MEMGLLPDLGVILHYGSGFKEDGQSTVGAFMADEAYWSLQEEMACLPAES